MSFIMDKILINVHFMTLYVKKVYAIRYNSLSNIIIICK